MKIAAGARTKSLIGGRPFVVINTPASVDHEKTSALDALDFVNFITLPAALESEDTTANMRRFALG